MDLAKRKDFWRKLCKRLRIQREKTCASLALFTLLVIYGIKPAYLIDVCSLDVDQAKYLVQELLNFSQSSEKIKIVQVGGDIFIVNAAKFDKRMSILFESLAKKIEDHEDQQIPTFAVIDLDFKPESSEIFAESINFYPRVKGSTTEEGDIENIGNNCLTGSLSAMELNRLFSWFSHAFDQNNDDEVLCVTTMSEIYQNLGGPLVAGLLLGYPSIYKTVPNLRANGRDEVNINREDEFMSPLYERACTKLSFKQLEKVTVFLDIELHDSFLRHAVSPSSNSINASIPILEFTYPLTIHSTRGEYVDFRVETLGKISNSFLEEKVGSFVSNNSSLSFETGRSDIFTIIQTRLETAEWNAEGISL